MKKMGQLREDDIEQDYFKIRVFNGEFNKSELFLYIAHEGACWQYRIELGERKMRILDSREIIGTPKNLLENAEQMVQKQDGRAAVIYTEDLKRYPKNIEEKVGDAIRMYVYAGVVKNRNLPLS